MGEGKPSLPMTSGAECHDIGPSDFRPLAEKWRTIWPEFFEPRQSSS
jgi:hypothetical protein